MQNVNLSLVRNDDEDLGLLLVTTSGTPYNLSGCAFTFTARQQNTYFSDTILTKTVSQHLDYTGGATQFSFSAADKAGISDAPHYYDIRLLSAAGKTTTLRYGVLSLLPQ